MLFDEYMLITTWVIFWFQMLAMEDEDIQFSCILGWAIYYKHVWGMYSV